MKIKDIIKKISIVLTFINKIIPKNEKKIVFYSNMGFRDNVKALHDYMNCDEFRDYKIVCSINDYKSYKSEKNTIFTSNLKGVFHFLTCKYFFYSFGKYPIKPSKKQVVVNLFHGTPLKRIGNMVEGDFNDYNYFTYVLATSETFVDIMMKSFNCSRKQVLICGHARNDKLFKENDSLKKLLINKRAKKVLIWLPTFRKSKFLKAEEGITSSESGLPLIKTKEELKALNHYLNEKEVFLLVKLHPAQDIENIDFTPLSNMMIITNNDIEKAKVDLYEILPNTDGLVTDYSSIYFDYMLLDKPMAFTIDDIEQYEKSRGFVFDKPLEFMPGKIIETLEDFKGFIDNVKLEEDEFRDKRRDINNLVNKYKDDRNGDRLLRILQINNKVRK